jgi:peptidoglycan/xylan/chitin deacetylase (PgdA/CDA1 family)
MIMTSLKNLTIVVALLAGGAALAMIGFLTRQQIIARQASAPESPPTAQHFRSENQIGQAVPVVTVQEAQPTPTPSAPAQNRSAENAVTPTTSTIPPCDKPDGLGLSRIVQIDTTGGPRFGLIQHPQGYDFLDDKEVVLTFDDGPWPGSTEAVLKALADQCLKATFFEIGEYARWHPEITKHVIDAGMTVGTFTWSHKDLERNPYAGDPEKARHEIEMGNSAVRSVAPGGKVAPFFRFPGLQPSPQLASYLADRNIAIFSTDIDSRDYTMQKPEPVVDSVMSQLEKRGKGIVLLQDFHRNTAEAMPELLRQLKRAGYKVVHMVPKEQLTTLPQYDEKFNHLGNISSSAQSGSATGQNVATQHSLYMYAPAHGGNTHIHGKGALKTDTKGGH